MAKQETKFQRIIEVFLVKGKTHLFGMSDRLIQKIAVDEGQYGPTVNIVNNSDLKRTVKKTAQDVSILQNSLALPTVKRQAVRGIV